MSTIRIRLHRAERAAVPRRPKAPPPGANYRAFLAAFASLPEAEKEVWRRKAREALRADGITR